MKRFIPAALVAGILGTGLNLASADIIRVGSDGRYIRVQNSGGGSRELHIGELEVFASGYTPPAGIDGSANNWALPAQGGSFESSQGPVGHGATSAVNNNFLDTGAATWTLSSGVRNNYILDLGQTRNVGSIRTWQRADSCCQNRLSNVSVSVLADNGGVPGDVISTRTFPGQVPTNSSTLFNMNDDRIIRPGGAGAIGVENVNGATGRFIRITNNGNNYLHLGEIEAFQSTDPLPAGTPGSYISNSVAVDVNGVTASYTGSIQHGTLTNIFDGYMQSGGDTFSLNPANGNSITVDLKQDYNLGNIRLWNRVDCCGDRLSNFTIEVLANNGGVPGAVVYSENFAGQVPQNGSTTFATLANDFTIRGNDTLQIELDLDTQTSDLLSVGAGGLGDLAIQPGATLELLFSGSDDVNGADITFDILDFATVSGMFSNVIVTGLPQGIGVDLSQLYVTGQITTTPEPASIALWLLAGGLGTAAWFYRRRWAEGEGCKS